MSLYNMLHGRNPFSSIFLRILDIDQENGNWFSGRIRDIHLNKEADKIILYTRNGGGNREHWDDEDEEGENCTCTGCIITYNLPKHPNYISDYDDDFDNTYAYVEFSVPEEHKVLVKEFMTGEDPKTVHQKFMDTMEEMEKMNEEDLENDERFKPILNIFKNITRDKSD